MTGNVNIHGSTGVDLRRVEAIANEAKRAADNVTKEQLGIENVDNTADADKPVSIAQQAALDKKADVSALSAHIDDTSVHVTEAERAAWNGKADASALSSHAENASVHVTPNEKNTWNGKADASHGTHVSFSSTAPAMDGTASVGSSSYCARSDHRHPTDTSRAAASDLSTHTADTSVHVTAAEKAAWNGKATGSHSHTAAEVGALPATGGTVSGSLTVSSGTFTVRDAGTSLALQPDYAPFYDGSEGVVSPTPAGTPSNCVKANGSITFGSPCQFRSTLRSTQTPSAPYDVANKKYVDSAVSSCIPATLETRDQFSFYAFVDTYRVTAATIQAARINIRREPLTSSTSYGAPNGLEFLDVTKFSNNCVFAAAPFCERTPEYSYELVNKLYVQSELANKANSSHTHPTSDLTGLTGTDYSTSRVRGIKLSATVPASLSNGCIALVYV